MVGFLASCLFSVDKMTENYSAKRMGTFIGVAWAFAFAASMLAIFLVKVALTNAIGFIAVAAMIAVVAVTRYENVEDDS